MAGVFVVLSLVFQELIGVLGQWTRTFFSNTFKKLFAGEEKDVYSSLTMDLSSSWLREKKKSKRTNMMY